jgi:hypothetical protein
MDISSDYIKMCEGAEEIQELSCRVGGFFLEYPDSDILIDATGSVYYADGATLQTTKHPKWDAIIWLPRQDQLQEMLPDCNIFKSMEQLWLARVMSKRFLKIWNGDKWILKTDK